MHRLATPVLGLALAASVLAAVPPAADELFAAARAGDLATVQALLDGGVPVDAEDRYGSTALVMAASKGHTEIVRLLLAHGADIDHAESFYGTRAVDSALFNGHPETAVLLLERGAEGRERVLFQALAQERLELARAAVAGGPLHASALARLRQMAADADPAWPELFARAQSRPDPPLPSYGVEELHRFTGAFEGWTSDTRIEALLREGELVLWLDGERLGRSRPIADSTFSAPGEIIASFFGRAGTIEGLRLIRPDHRPETLRRSVAEPAEATAARKAKTDGDESGAAAPTVHWPAFRGSNASGVGDGRDTAVRWSLAGNENILWQAEIPGLGNSSPVVWGDRVFVTTAVAEGIPQSIRTGLTGDGDGVDESVEHSWRVMAFDKQTGERLWDTEVGRGVPLTRRHFKATQANSSPATDGRYLVAVFPTAGLVCLDLDGRVLWKHELGGLNAGAFSDPGVEWGFASSPILHHGRVILQVDVHEGPYLAAWDLATGERVWRIERDVAPSWATPTVIPGPQGDELVVNGSTIRGYDAETGAELWSLGPNSELVIATPVAGDGVVYVSAGYPPVKPIYAVPFGVRGDLVVEPGREHSALAWSHRVGGAYMPTPLLYRGTLYVVHHNGRIVAYDPATGEAFYKSRFSRGGTFTGSPVAVNGKLYVPTEEGLLYVLEAGAEYAELAVNDLGEPLMATPAVSEGILLLRTPERLVAVAPGTSDSGGGSSNG